MFLLVVIYCLLYFDLGWITGISFVAWLQKIFRCRSNCSLHLFNILFPSLFDPSYEEFVCVFAHASVLFDHWSGGLCQDIVNCRIKALYVSYMACVLTSVSLSNILLYISQPFRNNQAYYSLNICCLYFSPHQQPKQNLEKTPSQPR